MSEDQTLHVAALPYPTSQGTQAALGAMMNALCDAGRPPRLLTYAHGMPEVAPRWRHDRLARTYGDRSLRSGPSLAKIAQDLALVRAIARSGQGTIVAHHVEATLAALLARAPATIFVAHAALGPEMPTYLPRAGAALSRWASRAGEALDVTLARRAHAVLAVSPLLAQRLSRRSGAQVRWLPIPWPIPAPIDPGERSAARVSLGVPDGAEVVLYAGNLDRYQGIDVLLAAMEIVRAARPDARLLIASASAVPADVVAARPILHRLEGDEAGRRRLHAAADVVAVPRAAEGGVPVKLLDALARGAPIAASRRALAGLSLDATVETAADDDPRALADAIVRVLVDRARARSLATDGRAWAARELSPERFLDALDRAIADARSTAAARRARSGA